MARVDGHVVPEAFEQQVERLRYRWEVLWPEDEATCRSVHQGLSSRGYRQCRFVSDEAQSAISEHAVHKFQLRYAEAMGL